MLAWRSFFRWILTLGILFQIIIKPKAKQILDAAAEIDAAKAEAEKLREQLALKEDILRNLQSANKSLEASLADKDRLLNAEKDAVVAVRKELERHIYEGWNWNSSNIPSIPAKNAIIITKIIW